MKALKISMIVSTLALGAASMPASAGICTKGFLADVACLSGLIDQETARRLDGIHGQMGAPLNRLNPFQGASGGQVPPMPPPMGPMPLPMGPMGPMQMPMPMMGNFCHTPAGRFGPGPLNPLGSPCWAATQWGPVNGWVGQ